MNIDPNKTYKVFHSLWYRGRNEGIFITDLQVDNGRYYLVFRWTTNHEGEYPSIRHEIDPSLLVPCKSDAQDFLIEMPVDIPENPLLAQLIQEVKRLRGGKDPKLT